jgi:hypothetical protein
VSLAPAALSTRSFTDQTGIGSDPQKLTYSGGTITVDLSAIQGATVYRATLYPDRKVNWGRGTSSTYSTQSIIITSQAGDTLELFGPRCLSLDATDAVKAAIASGSLALTVENAAGLGTGPNAIRLDVMCDRAAPTPVTQVTNASARFQDGDAMITFMEVNPPLTDTAMRCTVMHAAFANLDTGDMIRYRIYRSTQALTSEAALQGAELIDEITSLSMWNHDFYGINENYHGCKNRDVPAIRYPVDNEILPPAGTGIYVNRFTGTGSETAYYFVSHTKNGAEDFSSLTQGVNATGSVSESPGTGMVLLREVVQDISISGAMSNSTGYYYVRWECPPNANMPSTPHNYLVALPPASLKSDSFPVSVMLHCWGGKMTQGYGWWYRADEGSMLLATIQNPYDWWTAYHECLGTMKSFHEGTVKPYTQIRILSFLNDFVKNNYSIDMNRVLLAGSSMGGSGASTWGLRSGHIFSHIISWVGVHIPKESPGFYGSYSGVYGDSSWNTIYTNEGLARFGYPVITANDNVSVWDYWDNTRWLAANVATETPWMSNSNGKADGGIGWPQAWKNGWAMANTKRPYNFYFGDGGHGERAQLLDGTDRICGLDFRLNQSQPAFTNCTLDDDLGATPADAAAPGQMNRWFKWDVNTVVDQTDQWAMDILLINAAPSVVCTVDITPRRLQNLEHGPGSTYNWELVEGSNTIASGNVTADQNNLITIEDVQITKLARTLKLSCVNCVPVKSGLNNRASYVYSLSNYPNPFGPWTMIEYRIEGKGANVRMHIYDVNGKLVRTFLNGNSYGMEKVVWHGLDNNNRPVSSGIYVCRLESGNRVMTKRIILAR